MQVGQKVSGKYCGFDFSGCIVDMRELTVKTDGCFEFTIQLEKPMVIFGSERESILMNTKYDGTPSSYTKFRDFMV